jgi:hypothetical protein
MTKKNGVLWDVTPCGSCGSGFFQEPHGVTSQKTSFFIVTAVRISNPTELQLIRLRSSANDLHNVEFILLKYSYMANYNSLNLCVNYIVTRRECS